MYHWYYTVINIQICLSTINHFLVIFNSKYSPFSTRLLQTLPSAWAEGGWRKSITEYSTVPYTESCSRRPIGFHLSVLSSDMLGPKPLWLAESANTRIKSDMHLLYHNWTSLMWCYSYWKSVICYNCRYSVQLLFIYILW